MHSFYIEEGGRLSAEDAKHALRVLRLGPGDEVCAMDGGGRRWRARIASVADGVRLALEEELPSNEPPVRLTVYQGVPKADKLDFIAQKLTELGVSRLVPVRMERSVVKLDAKDGRRRRERLEKIAREACKQCGRGLPMEVAEPMDWRQALDDMAARRLLLTPWEEAEGFRLKDARELCPDARDIGIVIGPEGGMTAGEVDAMREVGARPVTLGPRILRAETAAVVSAALAMQLWGDI